MKYTLFFLLPLFLGACSHEPAQSNINGDTEISFDLDGRHYSQTGDRTISNLGVFGTRDTAVIGFTFTHYELVGNSDFANSVHLYIPTPSDTLKSITYHLLQKSNGGCIIWGNGVEYSFYANGDSLDLTITGYVNGIVNGNFSGVVSKILSNPPLVTQKATITNGQIRNIKMYY